MSSNDATILFEEKKRESIIGHSGVAEMTSDTAEAMHKRGCTVVGEFDSADHFLSQDWIFDADGPLFATSGDKLRIWAVEEPQ
jgi:hypothetical protein